MTGKYFKKAMSKVDRIYKEGGGKEQEEGGSYYGHPIANFMFG